MGNGQAKLYSKTLAQLQAADAKSHSAGLAALCSEMRRPGALDDAQASEFFAQATDAAVALLHAHGGAAFDARVLEALALFGALRPGGDALPLEALDRLSACAQRALRVLLPRLAQHGATVARRRAGAGALVEDAAGALLQRTALWGPLVNACSALSRSAGGGGAAVCEALDDMARAHASGMALAVATALDCLLAQADPSLAALGRVLGAAQQHAAAVGTAQACALARLVTEMAPGSSADARVALSLLQALLGASDAATLRAGVDVGAVLGWMDRWLRLAAPEPDAMRALTSVLASVDCSGFEPAVGRLVLRALRTTRGCDEAFGSALAALALALRRMPALAAWRSDSYQAWVVVVAHALLCGPAASLEGALDCARELTRCASLPFVTDLLCAFLALVATRVLGGEAPLAGQADDGEGVGASFGLAEPPALEALAAWFRACAAGWDAEAAMQAAAERLQALLECLLFDARLGQLPLSGALRRVCDAAAHVRAHELSSRALFGLVESCMDRGLRAPSSELRLRLAEHEARAAQAQAAQAVQAERLAAALADADAVRRERERILASLSCAVCLEPFVDRQPAALRCGHIFCLDCLEAVAAASVLPSCPTCRASFLLAGDDYVLLKGLG